MRMVTLGRKKTISWLLCGVMTAAAWIPASTINTGKVEAAAITLSDRGVVAVYQGSGNVYVGWRLLQSDSASTGFNVYRKTGSGSAVKLNSQPITQSTNWVDTGVSIGQSNSYYVRAVINGQEQAASASFTIPANAPARPYISVPLRNDTGQAARMVGTGDLDGDGTMDFVVKRGNGDIDPSQSTIPNETYKLEAYKSDGTFLWRVDLGKNIRPGIWYSPFVVYDLDGDGKAEVATKFGEVNQDWNGDGTTNYFNSDGRVLTGPEYLVILDGQTGAIRDRENWIARGNVCDWGDCYGNRVNRNLIGIAFLDGQRPSLITFRGTYTTLKAEAWNFSGGNLSRKWAWSQSGGGGFHNFRAGDIDNDGRDEIINGSVAIDDNGTTLWTTGEGHGDRVHMTDINPDRSGKEIFYIQEDPGDYENPISLREARTGKLIWGQGDDSWADVGRGLAADIDPRYRGLEVWSSKGDLYSSTGTKIGTKPSSVNMAIWWDADVQRELLDGTKIDKWNYSTGTLTRLLTAEGSVGSRSAPMGYGDIIGDWREEVWYIYNNSELRIYTTTIPSQQRFPTFLQDSDYRSSLAAETMGYMQATQPGTYFGSP
ncbi:rhamnogalacturonan lyase [Paenibacillus turpanensis]|uniref:rhamnogalacturonan lyase family protein n=1 Tax=Paenibacillus turpanensis TaxID=2689078 RepID=UPI0014088197|nr:rhamnogalacturonan lyase [Paenibacillus turpanensis]